MAVEYKQLEFAARSGTGSQVVTGVGFQPKLVVFICNIRTAAGQDNDLRYCIGGANSSSSEAVQASAADDAAEAGGELLRNDACILIINGAGTILERADFTTMDTDGFTLNWSTKTTTQFQITALCYGGSDFQGKVGTANLTDAGTGNESITGVGFQPELLICAGDGNQAVNTFKNKAQMGLSAAISSSARWNISGTFKVQDGMTGKAVTLFTNDHFMSMRKKTTQYDYEVDFVSMDSDGWTVNKIVVGMDPADWLYIAMEGNGVMEFDVGDFTKSTNTSTPVDQSVTGVGFLPNMMFLVNSNDAEGDNNTMFEFAQGSGDLNEEACRGCYAEDDSVGEVDESYDDAKIIENFDTNAGLSLDFEADLKTFDSDGFTITYTTNDADNDGMGYICWGGAVAPAGTPPVIQVNNSGLIL